jgi:putative transposase
MVYKLYTFQAYPNSKQKELIEKTFGACRKVYNEQVSSFNSYDPIYNPKPHQPSVTELKALYPYLAEVSQEAMSNSVRDFQDARNRFYKKQNNKPVFKKKSSTDSFTMIASCGRIIVAGKNKNRKVVSFNRIGHIKVKGSYDIQSLKKNHKRTTLKKSADGKYWITLLVSEEISKLPKTRKEIGLDLGLNHLLIDNYGNTWENKKFLLEEQASIAKMQNRLSKKTLGSNSYEILRKKIARRYRKVVNQKLDYLHKISINLVRNNDFIAMETLGIKDMLSTRSRGMSYSISEASWRQLTDMIEYKSNWYGKKFVQVDRYFASSKTCSECGTKHENLKLKDRVWTCSCGYTHLRDKNAAKNILKEAKRISS